MTPDHEVLSDAEWHKAHRVIASWKNEPDAAHPCPRCDATGIAVADQSARPCAEWFELTCSHCELVVTMHLPYAPTPGPAV